MKSTAKLRIVTDERGPSRASLDYEWQERQRIMRRDWRSVHVEADRRAPLPFWAQARRLWR